MTIYIFGANGMLGTYMKTYLRTQNKECICFTRDDLDVSTVTYDKLEHIFDKYIINENDVLINCIGIIPQSKNINDTSSRNYFLINSLFPNMISTFASMNKMKFIHITTDCVFSGTKGNYTEVDCHDETNNYGVSKSLGELGYNSTVIRTSIIGEELKNKYSLLEWVKKHNNTTINGYTNHYWNGVTCLQLSKIINNMIDENIWWSGVRHIYSPTSVTKYELVQMINDTYNLNNTIEPMETDNPINKTLTSIYDVNIQFNIPELRIQLEELNLVAL
jgi:dTDP-4-dehydrorhamnose reductase